MGDNGKDTSGTRDASPEARAPHGATSSTDPPLDAAIAERLNRLGLWDNTAAVNGAPVQPPTCVTPPAPPPLAPQTPQSVPPPSDTPRVAASVTDGQQFGLLDLDASVRVAFGPEDIVERDDEVASGTDAGSADQPQKAQASPHAGHRSRLRDRFKKGGGKAVPDYELLELVLFRAIARGDTKPLAKRLIAEFGSFAEVVNASDRRLLSVTGVGPAVIAEMRLIREASVRLLARGVAEKPVMSSRQSVIDYCHATLAYEDVEAFHIL
ncbi:MAG: hypothetical protein AAFU50_00150, partial [Pseudomonadota bacterium]